MNVHSVQRLAVHYADGSTRHAPLSPGQELRIQLQSTDSSPTGTPKWTPSLVRSGELVSAPGVLRLTSLQFHATLSLSATWQMYRICSCAFPTRLRTLSLPKLPTAPTLARAGIRSRRGSTRYSVTRARSAGRTEPK